MEASSALNVAIFSPRVLSTLTGGGEGVQAGGLAQSLSLQL